MVLFEWTLVLLFFAVLVAGFSRRIGVPYPSLLALAGGALAFVPSGPEIQLDPELLLALFIAPVLFDAAFDTSPRDLKRNLTPLIALVLVMVALTVAAVAYVGVVWGGLPIAAAIALGAIVAPPDAVAATAVLGSLKLPRRLMQILQGESLFNDAPALLIYRFAVVAAAGGFTLSQVLPMVALAAIGSVIAGYVLARVYMFATRRVNDAASFTVLAFVGTFSVWILAEQLHLSAIITIVVYAITMAQRMPHKHVAARPRQHLLSLRDAGVRAERARVRDHGPASAPDHRPPRRRRADRGALVRRRRAGDRGARASRLRLSLQHRRAREERDAGRRRGRGRAAIQIRGVWSAGAACAGWSRWRRRSRCRKTFPAAT